MTTLRTAGAVLPILIVTIALPAAPAPQGPDHARELAAILKLEDRRSLDGDTLPGYLAATSPRALRLRAALALGRIGSPVATPYHLMDILSDPDAEVRRVAVFALGEMDDLRGAPLAAIALSDADSIVRALAAEALGKLKDPGSVPALMGALKDDDREVVGMALLALWKIEPGARLSEQAAAARAHYMSGDLELRRRAAYFLMRAQMGHPDNDAIEAILVKVAEDLDPLVRSWAARGLGASKTDRATAELILLAADDDWRVRVNAFNGLKGRQVAASAGEGRPLRWPVYEKGLGDPDLGVALSALAALETLEAPEARERLVAAIAHTRPRFREVAALAIAGRDKQAALPMVAPLAADPVWSVRARAAEALASIGGDEAAAALARLASDSDARVRAAAVAAAAGLKTPAGGFAGNVATAALGDDDIFVRAAALGALEADAGPGRRELLEPVSAAYRRAQADSHNDARLAALNVAARLACDPARDFLESALGADADYLVRRRAAELLRDHFRIDRFDRLGSPATRLSEDDYVRAVLRAGSRVSASFDTAAGEIVVELFPADAPLTVDNFIRLAREGALDGLAFHRVVPNFVIQDGDPRGDGNGGPSWQIRCEINLRRYGEGALGMALSGKDTGGSQYFMTHSPQPHLDGGYTIFGQVVSGQEIVRRMVQGDSIRRVTVSESPR